MQAPLGFWDPLGPAASRPSYFEHIPQVSGRLVMSRCAHCLYDKTCNILCDVSHFASMLYLCYFLFWMVPYVSLICFACVAAFAVRDFRDLDYDLCFAYVISYQFCLFCEHFWMRRILPRFNGKRRRSINRCRLICGIDQRGIYAEDIRPIADNVQFGSCLFSFAFYVGAMLFH